MENRLLNVSLKFGFILAGCHVLFVLISAFIFDPDMAANSRVILMTILSWGLFILFVAMAHYQFNRENGNFISFKHAIFIGLIIIGISFAVSCVQSFITYRYFLNEEMKAMFSEMSQRYGLDEDFYVKQVIISSMTTLFAQIVVLFLIITVESQWKIYKKAGWEGWTSIVPFYNIIVLLDIVGKPAWWIILLLVPGVNIIFAIWIVNLLSKSFGKDEGFTFGLLVLPFIFYPMLGMSKAAYSGSSSKVIEEIRHTA
jgi:hypothetical protein